MHYRRACKTVDKVQNLSLNVSECKKNLAGLLSKIKAQVEKECGPTQLDRDIGLMYLAFLNLQVFLNTVCIQKWPNLPALRVVPFLPCW